jgi:hypothetical protein
MGCGGGCAFGIGVGARAAFCRRFDSWNIKKEIGRVGDSRTTVKELAEGRRKSEAQNARAQAQRTGEDLEGRLRAHKTATIWLAGGEPGCLVLARGREGDQDQDEAARGRGSEEGRRANEGRASTRPEAGKRRCGGNKRCVCVLSPCLQWVI